MAGTKRRARVAPAPRKRAASRGGTRPERRTIAEVAPVVEGSVPAEATLPPPEPEPPHAHAVCRVCGRIAQVSVPPPTRRALDIIAEHRPRGWTMEAMTISLTGACQRCREGRTD